MNDRIRELAEHCDFYVGNEHYKESYEEKQRLWTEKFAELIVQECVGITKHHVMNISTYADADFVEKQILKHFGVDQ